jgi:hypothetical protein
MSVVHISETLTELCGSKSEALDKCAFRVSKPMWAFSVSSFASSYIQETVWEYPAVLFPCSRCSLITVRMTHSLSHRYLLLVYK